MKEIALHVLDITENSLDAGATMIRINIKLTSKGMLEISIQDNGRGMDKETLDRTADPFFTSRTTRRVGMGIPMFRQHAELTGGNLEIFSKQGSGTTVKATFIIGHADIQPIGDIEGCWTMLAALHNKVDTILHCETPEGEFEISSEQVKQELEVENIEQPTLKADLKRLIRNNLLAIGLTDKIIDNKK